MHLDYFELSFRVGILRDNSTALVEDAVHVEISVALLLIQHSYYEGT